jgi:hypothetical protein
MALCCTWMPVTSSVHRVHVSNLRDMGFDMRHVDAGDHRIGLEDAIPRSHGSWLYNVGNQSVLEGLRGPGAGCDEAPDKPVGSSDVYRIS